MKPKVSPLLFWNSIASFYQGYVLTYISFGRKAISAGLVDGETLKIPAEAFWTYVNNHMLAAATTLLFCSLIAFFIQCIPIFIYSLFEHPKQRAIAAICIWAAPALIGLPTVFLAGFYLISPICAIIFIPDFLPNFYEISFGREEFTEGFILFTSIMGWFNIFWIIVAIKNCFHSR